MSSLLRSGIVFVLGIVLTRTLLYYSNMLAGSSLVSFGLQASILPASFQDVDSDGDAYDIRYSYQRQDTSGILSIQWGDVLQPTLLHDAFQQTSIDAVSLRFDVILAPGISQESLVVESPFSVTYAVPRSRMVSIYLRITPYDIMNRKQDMLGVSDESEGNTLVSLAFEYANIPSYARNTEIVIQAAWLQVGQERESLIVERDMIEE